MHKRTTNTTALLLENKPVQTLNMKSGDSGSPDKKKPQAVAGDGRSSKAQLPTNGCHVIIFCAAIFFMLVYSAKSVASNRSGLEYSSNDMNVRGARIEPEAYAAAKARYAMAKPRVDHEMTMEEDFDFDELSSSKEEQLSAGGSDEQTIGKMVVDALKSQKQTHEVTKSRMIIRKGDMSGKVPGSALESAAQQIEWIMEDPSYGEGGYVAGHTSTEHEYYSYLRRGSQQKAQRIINLNLRIPSFSFQLATERIKQIIEEASPDASEDPNHKGKITSLSISGHDVTDEFVDTAARADTLDASRNAIQVLLTQANTIKDVTQIQNEMNRLTQQSESLRRRALDLKNKSSLSTLNIRLEEWKEADGTDDDISHGDDWKRSWSPLDSAYLALKHVSFLLNFAFDTLAYSLVWAVPGIIVYSVGFRIVSKFSNGGTANCVIG